MIIPIAYATTPAAVPTSSQPRGDWSRFAAPPKRRVERTKSQPSMYVPTMPVSARIDNHMSSVMGASGRSTPGSRRHDAGCIAFAENRVRRDLGMEDGAESRNAAAPHLVLLLLGEETALGEE